MAELSIPLSIAAVAPASSSAPDAAAASPLDATEAARRVSMRPRKEPKYRIVSSAPGAQPVLVVTAAGGPPAKAANLNGQAAPSSSPAECPTADAAQSTAAGAAPASSVLSRRTRSLKRGPRYPVRAPQSGAAHDCRSRAWIFTRDGAYRQIGDIVSVSDAECRFYAQIRELFRDSDLTPSCRVVWLAPRHTAAAAAADGFEPSSFFLGPTDDAVRALDSLQFVCHCPVEFFSGRGAALAARVAPDRGVVWTTLGREIAAGRETVTGAAS